MISVRLRLQIIDGSLRQGFSVFLLSLRAQRGNLVGVADVPAANNCPATRLRRRCVRNAKLKTRLLRDACWRPICGPAMMARYLAVLGHRLTEPAKLGGV